MPSDPTARQKAMADGYAEELQAMATAMRRKHDIELRESAWDADRYWLVIARTAKEAQLNLGNDGPRVYLMGANAIPVTDVTTTMGTTSEDEARDRFEKEHKK